MEEMTDNFKNDVFIRFFEVTIIFLMARALEIVKNEIKILGLTETSNLLRIYFKFINIQVKSFSTNSFNLPL